MLAETASLGGSRTRSSSINGNRPGSVAAASITGPRRSAAANNNNAASRMTELHARTALTNGRMPLNPKLRKIVVEQAVAAAAATANNATTTQRAINTATSIAQPQQQQQQQRNLTSSRNSINERCTAVQPASAASAAASSSTPFLSSANRVTQSSSQSTLQQQNKLRAARESSPVLSPVLSQSARRSAAAAASLNAANGNTLSSGIPKSASLPASLAQQSYKQQQKKSAARKSNGSSSGGGGGGILKRSSSSLLAAALEARNICSYILPSSRRNRRSNSCLSGQTRKSKSPSPVRKCVSFSSDTSFVERTSGASGNKRNTALHEAKQYKKGVLQDKNRIFGGYDDDDADEEDENCRLDRAYYAASGCSLASSRNLPTSWEESLGGPKALLGAAQEGDDELVKKIISIASKVGLGSIDLNAVDSSGRSAISYMAGNGSALMLEACLAFPGADSNLADNEGNTPLHFAAQAGQTECLNILLQRCPNIEVDSRNSLGFTPLMKAALQGRTKCAKILLFAGANPTLRDHGRGLRAEQWARFCGRYVCAEVIERFARHRLLEKTTSCRWGSEPELAAQVLQGKLLPVPMVPVQPPPSSGLKSKIRRVFRTSSNTSEKSFSLVSQLTSAALCASSPVLPKPGDVSPVVKNLLRPLSVPQLRITLVTPGDMIEKATLEKCCTHTTSFSEKIESTMVKPPRTKKKSK